METQRKGVSLVPKIAVGLTGLFFVVSVLVLVVSILLPTLNSHVSWDEAMIGIIIGGLLTVFSFVMLGGSIVWLWLAIRARK